MGRPAMYRAMNAPDLSRLESLQIETVLAGATLTALRPRFDRLAARHENGTAPRAVSAFNLFQTPASVAARLVGVLDLKPGARVLEPSAGLGRIIEALPKYCGDVVAVEIAASVSAELFRRDWMGVTLLQRDFLTCTPAELGLFDAVAMNPPFHMRADIRHILHAITFLKPGGRLAALCLDTHHREKALRHRAATWEQLPETTFAKEGTHVRTVLATFTA